MANFEGENLWTAASDGDFARVQFLLESGAHNVNDADESGRRAAAYI